MSAAARFFSALRADHAMLRRYDTRYDATRGQPRSLAEDVVQRVGFQMMVAYRFMRLSAEAGIPLVPKVIARLIRIVYGADIHPDAGFEGGVVIIHGMGLAVHGKARVSAGVILSQNVTLGSAIDPRTRAVGAPALEESVHVGPGATILGPITIGAHSKIMPGAVVRESVPPGSLVETPAPRVVPRRIAEAS